MTISTREALLQEAELLIRTRGYSAFSYADLANKVGIRKASIHHHFPTKGDLGLALIDDYLVKFSESLSAIEKRDDSAKSKLYNYAQFFVNALGSGGLPLCGALAAETLAMPASMRERTKEFFELHLRWIARIVTSGIVKGEFRGDVNPRRAAELLLSALEGASLVAWSLDRGISVGGVFETVLESMT